MTENTTGGREYVAALTGLRGVAAGFVFLFHYHHFNPDIRLDQAVPGLGLVLQFPLGFGFMGVDLFFVLSGFLLTLPFAAARLSGSAPPAMGRYFRRRFLRVFPAYYAQLFIIALVGSWFLAWRPLSAGEWAAHGVMFFNAGPDPVRPLVGLWWTLPVELSFYLLLPALALLMRPARWTPFLVVAIIASLGYRYWAIQHFDPVDPLMLAISHLPGSLPEFLIGATAAIHLQRRRLHETPPASAGLQDLFVLSSMMMIGCWFYLIVLPEGVGYWDGHWSLLVAPVVLGALLVVLVSAVFAGSRVGRFLFANRPVYWLGMISYSLYLWHFVVLQQMDKVMGGWLDSLHGGVRFLLVSLVVLTVASLSYWAVERPFYRLGPRRKPS